MKALCIALLVATTFAACKKDKVKPAVSIEGKWVGKYGTGNNNPSVFYSFNIKSDGTLQELNAAGEVVGEGEWELDNNILYANYSSMPPNVKQYTILGAFNKNAAKILGNWGYDDSATNGGLWEMNKQ